MSSGGESQLSVMPTGIQSVMPTITAPGNNLRFICSRLLTSGVGSVVTHNANSVTVSRTTENDLNDIISNLPLSATDSFIQLNITDIETSVNAYGSTNVTSTQIYNDLINKFSSQQVNFNSNTAYLSALKTLNTSNPNPTYYLNNSQTIGSVVDNSTSFFGNTSTANKEKLLTVTFYSTQYPSVGCVSILETGSRNHGNNSRSVNRNMNSRMVTRNLNM